MSKTETVPPRKILAEAAPAIGILFSDASITEVFAALLESRGRKVQILQDPKQLSSVPRQELQLVTETCYAASLGTQQYKSCLVVGPASSSSTENVISLTQPLTLQKIESALAQFLG
jgi:hypothetical protein